MREFFDFIWNPSYFSESLIKKLNLISKKYENQLPENNLIKRNLNLVKFSYFYATKYIDYFDLVRDFDIRYKINTLSIPKLKQNFFSFYENAILSNILFCLFKDEKDKYFLITKEEEKNMMLKKLNKQNYRVFINRFGQYSLNRFEVTEKRFSEYSYSELMKLSIKLKNYTIPSYKVNFDEKNMGKYKPSEYYHYLRDEFDYHALKFISEIRKKGFRNSGDYFETKKF